MQTMFDFINRNQIMMKVEATTNNPNFVDSDDMDHWHCTFTRFDPVSSPIVITFFSTGVGHRTKPRRSWEKVKPIPPSIGTVLSCLAQDAAGVENAKWFDNWCSECGYDSDSRKAERIWNLCREGARELEEFLGHTEYQALLFDTEPL